MNHSPVAYLSAALSLAGVPGLFARAARSDFSWLLSVQAGLSSLPSGELRKKEQECRATTEQRQTYLRRKTVTSLVWVLFAVLAAMWIVYPYLTPTSATRQQMFGVASVVSFSWGTLGRLGWNEKSTRGATLFEELDNFMFWLLYWVGTVCGVAAVVTTA